MAVLLITAAVLFSAVRAVLPYATGYKNEIQQEISKQIGLPVEIDSIDAEIYWFTPRLKLIGVVVYDEQHIAPLFDFKEAFVGLDVIGSMLRGELIADDVGLVEADISIEKLSETEWIVQGIKITTEGSDEGSGEIPNQLIYMIKNSDYLLHDSNIFYQDHTGDRLSLKLLNVNIDVRNDFNNHDIRFSMNLPEEYGESLALVASLSGDIDTLDGDIYVDVKQVHVKQWMKKFQLLESFLVDARVDAEFWVTLDESKIKSLVSRLASENLTLKNHNTNKSWHTNYLSTELRYLQDGEHWNIAVSDFYFGEEAVPEWGQRVNAIASDDDNSYFLSAEMLRYSDIKDIVEVFSSKEQLKDLASLAAYNIQLDAYNISLQVAKDFSAENNLRDLYLEASVDNFYMFDAGSSMRVEGIDGSVLIDDEKITIDMLTQDATIEFDELFRESIYATELSGSLLIQQEEKNWHLQSERLQLINRHIKTYSRLDAVITPDHEVIVDMQTNFFDAYGKYARHYLPVGVMSPELVDWLDMAVVDGYVPQGTFILKGALSDFPYNENNGIFQVYFSPEKVNLKFLDDWPIVENISGTLKFINQSLYLTGARGVTLNTSLYNGYAEIPDLNEPNLTVKTDAEGLNEDVQAYVWNSPLDEILGETLSMFQFEGNSKLALTIDVPLYADEIEVKVDGHLNFINSSMYYPTLGYDLDEINGVIDFTKESIFADTVEATIDGKPVLINAFTQAGEFGQEVVFHMDGVVAADYLLKSYDWVPEEWIGGDSFWSANIEIPYHAKDYLVHIKASSLLEDVVIGVSDKVSKPNNNKLALTADIDVLPNKGLFVEVLLTDPDKNPEAVEDVAQGNIAQSNAEPVNEVSDEAPAKTKRPAGEILNVFAVRDEDYIWKFDVNSEYMTGKGEFTEGLAKETQVALNLESIDVHAMFVKQDKKESEPLLPSDFPPLNWRIKKVIWDDWVLSDVVVETDWHKHGMLINKYSFSGHEMSFDARGTWLTSWRGTHETVLQGNVKSSNFGVTLSGLGFQRSIDRAKYSASFNSKWSAPPYAWSWENMKGKINFEMKDGEILEVDPGAGGRLLGLLNIFRLANRLAFDFDDVYRDGYSFDSITGDFEFVNGDGYMKDFEVSAPAADITMFGSIGMVKKDYGLLMRVKPHTDTITFAGGTLLGGVVVGASLALVQKLFDLGVIGHNVYSITGTWDVPIIEKIVEKTVDSEEDEDF